MIVLLKILAIILYILGGCVVMYGLSLDTIRDKDTSLKYYLYQNRGFIILLFVLVGVQIIQFGYMCWDNSTPYIIFGSEDEPWVFHWTDTIRNKFIAASVLGLIYYIALFFERKKAFAEYENSEYEKDELKKENKELKNRDSANLIHLEDSLQRIADGLDDQTYIYIKCSNGNVYRLGQKAIYGKLIHNESDKKIFIINEETPFIEDIAHAIHRNDAYILAITSKNLEFDTGDYRTT
jgi:hypothetical protein